MTTRREEIAKLLWEADGLENFLTQAFGAEREEYLRKAAILEPYVVERELAEANWWQYGPQSSYGSELKRIAALEAELSELRKVNNAKA